PDATERGNYEAAHRTEAPAATLHGFAHRRAILRGMSERLAGIDAGFREYCEKRLRKRSPRAGVDEQARRFECEVFELRPLGVRTGGNDRAEVLHAVRRVPRLVAGDVSEQALQERFLGGVAHVAEREEREPLHDDLHPDALEEPVLVSKRLVEDDLQRRRDR